MRSDTGIFREERSFPDFGCNAAEAVDQESGAGDAALVGGGVDAGDGSADNWVVSRNLLEGGELSDKGLGDDLCLESRLDGLDGDDKVLRLEVGVNNRVPLSCELLELVDRVGEVVQLAQTALALGLDAVADVLGEVFLEVNALLEELVLELLLIDLVGGFELRFDLALVGLLQTLALVLVLFLPVSLLLLHLVVEALDEFLGSLVKLGVGSLDLVLRLLVQVLLQQGDVRDDLGEFRLGLVQSRVVLSIVCLVGVDYCNEVVDDLDDILDDGLARGGHAQVVDLGNGLGGGVENNGLGLRLGLRLGCRGGGLLPLLLLLL